MDLATLMQMAAELNGTQTAQAKQQSDLLMQASTVSKESSQVLQQAGADVEGATRTKLLGELATQQDNLKAAQAFGTDIGAQTDVLTPLAEIMRQTSIEYVNAAAYAAEVEAGSDLFGNPVGWLKDLVVGDGVRGRRDALESQLDAQSKVVQNLNAATQQTVQTQNAITQTLNSKSIEQLARAEAAKYTIQANEATIESIKLGANSIGILSATAESNFSRSAQMFNMQQQAEQMAFARAERAERLKDKKDAANEAGLIAAHVNAYNEAVGDPFRVDEATVKRYWGSNTEMGKRLQEGDIGGMRMNQTGSLAGLVGTTPAESYARVNDPSRSYPESWAPAKKVLDEAFVRFNTWADSPDPMTGKTNRASLKGEELAKKYDQFVAETAKEKSARVVAGENNPMDMAPLPSIVNAATSDPLAASVANSKFRTAVIDPLVTVGLEQPGPDQLLAFTADAVAKGELSSTEAVKHGTDMIRAGMVLKGATGGFSELNVPISATYNVPAKFLIAEPAGRGSAARSIMASGSLGFGFSTEPFTAEQKVLKDRNTKVLNLAKPEDFQIALQIMMSQRASKEIQQKLRSGQQ